MSKLQEQLEKEVEQYNAILKTIESAEKDRIRRLGRIELLQEQVEAEGDE